MEPIQHYFQILLSQTAVWTRNFDRTDSWEIATEAMVRSSAEERIKRALETKSRQSDLTDNYQAGEAVELYRKPSTKDVSGWHGPAMIIYVKDRQVFIK